VRRDDQPAGRLLHALDRGDDVALAAVLHPAAHLVVDTGDASGSELHGRAGVTRELRDRLTGRGDTTLETADVNGAPGLALRRVGGDVIGVLAFETDAGGRITELWLSTVASKLAHWNRRPPASP
jgi:hypothetical protein